MLASPKLLNFLFWVFFLHLVLSAIYPNIGFACQPCAKKLDFSGSLKAAELVIVGAKLGQHADLDGGIPQGPEYIQVRVKQVLKGTPSGAEIKVNSWDAMCSYGIVVDNRDYLMLLVSETSSHDGSEYDAVNNGCAVKQLLVEDRKVQIEGKELSVSDVKTLISKYSISKK